MEFSFEMETMEVHLLDVRSAFGVSGSTASVEMVDAAPVDLPPLRLAEHGVAAGMSAESLDGSVCLQARGAKVSIRYDKTVTQAGCTVSSVDVVDRVQRVGEGWSHLISSTPPDDTVSSPQRGTDANAAPEPSDSALVDLDIVWRACPDPDTESAVSVACNFNTVHIEWNPDTVAALHRLLSGYMVPYADVHGQPVVSTGGPAPASSGTSLPAITVSKSVSLVPEFKVQVQLRRLSMSLNKEVSARKLLLLSVQGAHISFCDFGGHTRLAGHVGNLVARDTVTVGTKYPHVLGLAGPGARVGSEGRVEGAPSIDVDGVDPSDVASSLVAFSIVAFDPTCPTYAGVDTAITINVQPMTIVYTQQLWLEVVDYVFNGVLGTILMNTAQSAEALAAAQDDKRLALHTVVRQPRVVLPPSPWRDDHAVATLAVLRTVSSTRVARMVPVRVAGVRSHNPEDFASGVDTTRVASTTAAPMAAPSPPSDVEVDCFTITLGGLELRDNHGCTMAQVRSHRTLAEIACLAIITRVVGVGVQTGPGRLRHRVLAAVWKRWSSL